MGAWNTQLFDPWPWVQFWLGLGLFVAVIPLLWRRPVALLFYVCGTAGLTAAFVYLMLKNPYVYMRYNGQYFLVFVASCWIYQYAAKSRRRRGFLRGDRWRRGRTNG